MAIALGHDEDLGQFVIVVFPTFLYGFGDRTLISKFYRGAK